MKNWLLTILIATSIVGVSYGQVVDPKYTDIIVKVGDGAGYEDGDVLHAFNEKQILNVHAQHAVNPKDMERVNGRIVPNSLLEKYLEEIQELKFERISETSIRRTNLWTGEVDTISNVPNKNGEYMDVPLYLERRITLQPDRNKIFGSEGSEYWYGGGTRITDANMDEVWDEIESRTSRRRSKEFPFTENEKRSFMVMKVENLSDEEVADITRPLLDENGNILKARAAKVDISKVDQNIGRMQTKDIRNRAAVNLDTILK